MHACISVMTSWAVLAISAATLAAQAAPADPNAGMRGWVGAGLGVTAHGGLSGRVGANIDVARWNVGVRLTANSGARSQHKGLFGRLRDEFHEAGLLIGRVVSAGRRHRLVLSAGVARVWGERAVTAEYPSFFGTGTLEDFDARIGVPLEAALSLPLSRLFAVGVNVHGNINTEAPFFGLTGNLLFGKIR